ncbi:MAG: hypothetical protein KAU14_00195 [Thermoplasmata archaeon]|nr:hypothetical protein [Thermoplasmata archaeon]
MNEADVMKLRITFRDNFHTTGRIHGSTIDVLRDKDGRPYIPGSHTKGVVRTEAERIWFSAKGLEPCNITDMKEGFRCPNEEKCPICGMFGYPNQRDTEYREGVLRFYDARMAKGEVSPLRTHVSMNREKESGVDGGLYSEKIMEAGSVFEGFIVIRRPLKPEEEGLLKGAVASAGWYGLGKDRSRGLGGAEMELLPSSIDELVESMGVRK